MTRLFEAFEEGLGAIFFSWWRFWEIIVKVLEGDEGEVMGVKFVDLCLERRIKIIRYVMYSERQNISLRTRYDSWEGGMMRSSKGFESGQQLFSRVCVCVLFASGFCCLVFQKRIPSFWQLQRTIVVHWVYKVDHRRDGCSSLWGFLKQWLGEVDVLYSCLLSCQME
jgi:hypothetical protein